MKIKNNQRLQMNLLATIATIVVFSALVSAFAANGIGAKYGTRDPRTCADTKAPKSGPMTAALATKYVISSLEGVNGDQLYLVENLTVQVGGGVPYNPRTYPYAQDIDTKALIYPLRGSFKEYQCDAVNEGNKGYNCNIYPKPKATGVCMKTTFGDWNCHIDDLNVDRSKTEYNVPPPTESCISSAK